MIDPASAVNQEVEPAAAPPSDRAAPSAAVSKSAGTP